MTDKKADTSKQEVEVKPVADLLASILNEVRNQVLCQPAPQGLQGDALRAVEQFREIGAALSLQPQPTITLKAEPRELPVNGGISKLTWASTGAQSVSIDPGVGVVTPAAGGSIAVRLAVTTTFTATAANPCGSVTAPVTVIVSTLT
jgi:hypothetical protein